MPNDFPVLNVDLLRRYDRPGPRYTSYPTAPHFRADFGVARLREHAQRSNAAQRSLSLYFHIPFCFSPCFYCACTRLITRDTARGGPYIRRLLHELHLLQDLIAPGREVVQLHLGGGTPNFLGAAELEELMQRVGHAFRLSSSPERAFSIELDPRHVPEGYPSTLTGLGFNRVSLGVQDFDPEVQRAVNRMQSVAETLDLIELCRDSGVRSVNVDLIYGLPRQSPVGFRRTLRTVMSARPDRLAVYAYAHLPELFKGQRRIDPASLPGPEARLDLLRLAIEELGTGGYRYIGMDHFALPGDDLVRAKEAGGLQRNFMGYTTHADTDLLGLGMSAISHIGDSFSQNYRELKSWESALDADGLPLWRGLALSEDDSVRSAVIGELMCRGAIEIPAIERRYRLDFAAYFADALARLMTLAADGLVRIEPERISVTPAGRLLLRSVAMCFDRYLDGREASAAPVPYSKVI